MVGSCEEIKYSKCYTEEQLKKISDGIIELRKCRIELSEKNSLIDQRLIHGPGMQEFSWYQEPTVIIGGLVVTIGITSVMTYLIIK